MDYRTKHLKEYTSKDLTLLILALIATGSLIILVPFAPGLGLLFKMLDADRRGRARLTRKIHMMEQSGYIARGEKGYRVTVKGRRLLSEKEVWNLKPFISKNWNGKWHAVLFDIPKKKERIRHVLRDRLNELGFVLYQNSVLIHKYDMRDILLPFIRFYGLVKYVSFIEISRIDKYGNKMNRGKTNSAMTH